MSFDTTIFRGKTIFSVDVRGCKETDTWTITFTDGSRYKIDCGNYRACDGFYPHLRVSQLAAQNEGASEVAAQNEGVIYLRRKIEEINRKIEEQEAYITRIEALLSAHAAGWIQIGKSPLGQGPAVEHGR